MAKSETGVSKGFVRNQLIRVEKGEGNNVDTTTSTTTTTTTTTTQTPAAGAGGAGEGGNGGGDAGGADVADAGADGDNSAAPDADSEDTDADAADTDAGEAAAEPDSGRKRRSAGDPTTTTTTTTTTTIYYKSNYVRFVVESQFLDKNTTLAEFQGIVTDDVVPNLSGLEAVDVPDPVCKNENLTELMPALMPTMTHDKTINMVNRFYIQNSINLTLLQLLLTELGCVSGAAAWPWSRSLSLASSRTRRPRTSPRTSARTTRPQQ